MAYKETPRWREWVSEKINPAQPDIQAGQPISSGSNILEYEQAYSDIEIIHRAVEMVINACIEVPLIVEGKGPAKKVNKLLNISPNPFEDRVRMFRRAFLDFHLDGNAFFYYDRENSHLFLLPANDVTVVADARTLVSHYEYNISFSNEGSNSLFSGPKTSTKNTGRRFETTEIIHIMTDNDESIYRGSSKIKPVKRLIELYYYMINFQRQFFKNNALPGFVLTTDNILSKRVKERLLDAWRSTYTTIFDGARNPAILDGGLKIDSFSSVSFDKLDFEGSIERIQQDMSKALGVPYILLKSGNNANIDANQKLFYLHTVLPILTQFSSAFAHFFNNDIEIRPDRLAVPALQPDNKTQASYYATLVNTGIITPNEAREGLRFAKLKDNDIIRVPQNITGSATDASQGGRPPSGENVSEEETDE